MSLGAGPWCEHCLVTRVLLTETPGGSAGEAPKRKGAQDDEGSEGEVSTPKNAPSTAETRRRNAASR